MSSRNHLRSVPVASATTAAPPRRRSTDRLGLAVCSQAVMERRQR